MSEQKNNSIFKRIHTDRFTWHDSVFILTLIVFMLVIMEQIVGFAILAPFSDLFNSISYGEILFMYLGTIGAWIVTILYISITKYNRPILKVLTPKAKGNTIKMLLLGILVGFLQNGICIFAAVMHGDIYLSYDKFEVVPMLILFLAVFIQSSSEELICRGFLYQRLKRGYRNPFWWILGNAVIFSALHLMNPGISFVPLLNIALIAVFYSFIIYYFDSIWFAMGAHAAWNYTQNILFGLPNSGIVSSFSFMKLDASTARDSWIYNVKFGVEGTIMASLIVSVSIAAAIYLGKRYGVNTLDIWAEQELKKA